MAPRSKNKENKADTASVNVLPRVPSRGSQKTPLEIMILIMNKALKEGDHEAALNIAYKAAPYCHPKLTESKTDSAYLKRAEEMTEEELKRFISQTDHEIGKVD